jgi:hypothetical protein
MYLKTLAWSASTAVLSSLLNPMFTTVVMFRTMVMFITMVMFRTMGDVHNNGDV